MQLSALVASIAPDVPGQGGRSWCIGRPLAVITVRAGGSASASLEHFPPKRVPMKCPTCAEYMLDRAGRAKHRLPGDRRPERSVTVRDASTPPRRMEAEFMGGGVDGRFSRASDAVDVFQPFECLFAQFPEADRKTLRKISEAAGYYPTCALALLRLCHLALAVAR